MQWRYRSTQLQLKKGKRKSLDYVWQSKQEEEEEEEKPFTPKLIYGYFASEIVNLRFSNELRSSILNGSCKVREKHIDSH